MYAIEIKNLHFSYTKGQPILKNLNITIPFNKFVCIVGHNGSGKSTLSKLLSGLVLADKGTIHVCNILMNVSNTQQILNKLGLVFQNPDNQFVGITPEEDISFGLENRRVSTPAIKAIVNEIADFLNIKDLLSVNSSQLSGGQKQKVAISSILANNPQIIIFDESTSLLDDKGRKEIQQIMKDLVRQEGKTVISITHDMEELLVADEVIILKDGELVKHDKSENILNDVELLKSCNLNLPFIHSLRSLLIKKNINLPEFKNEDECVRLIDLLTW